MVADGARFWAAESASKPAAGAISARIDIIGLRKAGNIIWRIGIRFIRIGMNTKIIALRPPGLHGAIRRISRDGYKDRNMSAMLIDTADLILIVAGRVRMGIPGGNQCALCCTCEVPELGQRYQIAREL